jgi:hypothetical protein
MSITPSIEEVQTRLRLDDALIEDVQSAIEQAHAAQLAHLDRAALHPDADSLAQAKAADPLHSGIVVTPDLIAAQLLRIDALVGANTMDDRDAKEAAAQRMELRHCKVGA